jgi:hypothetical protein
MVCHACNTSVSCGQFTRYDQFARSSGSSTFDLWVVGAAHFVILFASFQVPFRLGWKQDLRQLMPFNRKLLWVQSGFTVLTIIAFGTSDIGVAQGNASGRACCVGTCLLHRDLLDYSDSRGRALLFPRGLAEGNSISCGTHTPDPSVFCACGKLPRTIYLERVAATK